MHLALRYNISLVSRLWCFKTANMDVADPGTKFVTMNVLAYSKHTNLAVLHWLTDVLSVHSDGNIAKIGNAIVASIAIDVVDYLRRQCPVNVKPRQSVGSVASTIYPNLNSATETNSSLISNTNSSIWLCQPAKNTRFLIVGQQFTKSFGCDGGHFHWSRFLRFSFQEHLSQYHGLHVLE